MSMIAFTWTTAPLLAEEKSWTFRGWTWRYAQQFHDRDLVDAWDKSPRNGGIKVAIIRLTEEPRQITTAELTDADYEGEGLGYLARHPERCPARMWGKPFDPYYVSRAYFDQRRREAEPGWRVDFELVEILVIPAWLAAA